MAFGLTPNQSAPQATNPFSFFDPTVRVTRGDQQRLDQGEAVVRLLPGESGEIVVFAAVRTAADGPRLARWARDIVRLKQSAYATAIARFSDPPRLEDLRSLELDPDDLDAARRCRPADCDLKLTASEMASLRAVADQAGAAWPPALQEDFRRLMLRRVTGYLRTGHADLPPYADRDAPVSLRDEFSLVLGHSRFLGAHAPRLAQYLEDYPHAPANGIESFVYWSKERLGGRPSVTATHVAILETGGGPLPEAIVAGKQIFATHYVTGSLNVTAIVPAAPPAHYLVYINRSRVDVLARWYRGLARMLIERRLESEAADVFQGLKARLESGDPR